MVTVVLVKHTRKKLAKDNKKRKDVIQGTVKAMISIVSVMVMFGLSWFFGALSISDGAIFFQWPFIIFNTSQGFILFLFSCVIGKDARDEWIGLLTCNRQKRKQKRRGTDSHSYTSNSKGTTRYQKSAAGRSTSYTTKQTDLRSTSTSYTKSNVYATSIYNSETPLSEHVLTKLDDNLNSIAEETKMDLAKEPLVSKPKQVEAAEELKSVPEPPTPAKRKRSTRKKNESVLPPHVLFRLNRPYYDVIVEDTVPTELSQETEFTQDIETAESGAPPTLSQETDFTQETSIFDVYANLTGDSTVALID